MNLIVFLLILDVAGYPLRQANELRIVRIFLIS